MPQRGTYTAVAVSFRLERSNEHDDTGQRTVFIGHSIRHYCGKTIVYWRFCVLCVFNCTLRRLYLSFCSAPQCSHCKRCTSYGNSVRVSVRPSVTRRYCVKTTARSRVQFALSDSKMCLVLSKPKNIPQRRPFLPEILAPSDLPPPDSNESWHVLPCSASTVRASGKSSIMANRKSYTGFSTSHQPRFYAVP